MKGSAGVRAGRRVVLGSIALALAAAGVAAPSASAESGTERGTNFGRVRNYTGGPVNIRCDYGSTTSYYLFEKYGTNPQANSTYFCPGDTDQFRSQRDLRCMTYTGPGYADGTYRLAPDTWRKVSGGALVKVYAYTSSQCGGKPYFTFT